MTTTSNNKAGVQERLNSCLCKWCVCESRLIVLFF